MIIQYVERRERYYDLVIGEKKKDIKLVKKLKKIHDPSTKFSIFRKRREERGGKTEVFHAIGRVPKAGEENRQVCSETGSL